MEDLLAWPMVKSSHCISVSYGSFIALALPAIASSLLNHFYRVVDQYFVQWLGTEAQAALAASSFILIACYAFFLVVSVGVTPIIGRACGSGDGIRVARAIKTSSILGIITGLIFSLCLISAAPHLGSTLGLASGSALALEEYLSALAWGGLGMAFGPLIDSIMIASGDTKTPMYLQLLSTILNAFLNYFLIYEFGLGMSGAAYATGISRTFTSIIGIWMIWLLHLKEASPSPAKALYSEAKSICRVGTPASLGVALYAFVYWALLKTTITPLGPEVTAALGIGFSALEGMSWPLFAGLMNAVSSLTGRLIGAGDEDQLKLMLRRASHIVLGTGLSVSIIFWWGAKWICPHFTHDPQVLNEAILYAEILAFSQLFVAFEAFYEGAMNGVGYTSYQLWLSIPCNIARVPLGYYLAFHLGLGAAGVWWAINLTTYLKTLGKGLLLKSRPWTKISI